MPITTDPTLWYYSGEHRNAYTGDLKPGDIVVWDRKPYRVLEVTPRAHIDWSPKYLEQWEKEGSPDPVRWRYRPSALVLGKESEADPNWRQHLEAGGLHRWTVLPEHYAICRLCGELPPCRHEYNEAVVEHATEKMAEAMAILPGFCHACKESIRPRQGSIRFEGENLIRPDLGDGSAVFHTRRQCFDDAFRYDEKWAVAEPGRQGKLSCTGRVIHHFDSSNECSLGVGCAGPMDALGESMRHRGGEVWHSTGRGYADDCWCTSGGPRPESLTTGTDNDRLF